MPEWNEQAATPRPCAWPIAALMAGVSAGALSAPAAGWGFAVGAVTTVMSQQAGGPHDDTASFAAGVSSFGDHASGTLAFDLASGTAALSGHACAAPQTPFDPAGGAQASDDIEVTFAYFIRSNTLPAGTPVQVRITVAAARSVGATYTFPKTGGAFGDFADASVGVTMGIGGVQFFGSAYIIDYQDAPKSPGAYAGIFVEDGGETSVIVDTAVGNPFNLYLHFSGSARARAITIGSYADGHFSASLCWGVEVIGADAQILRDPEETEPFPGSKGATGGHATDLLPPPPLLGPCYGGVCPDGYYCAKEPGSCDSSYGVCTPMPTECDDVDDPVCGCDGRNFRNACEAAAVGVSVAYRGPCGGGSGEPWDIDGDRQVNGNDLAVVLGQWGMTTPPAGPWSPGDINHDGIVDGNDLALILGHWTG